MPGEKDGAEARLAHPRAFQSVLDLCEREHLDHGANTRLCGKGQRFLRILGVAAIPAAKRPTAKDELSGQHGECSAASVRHDEWIGNSNSIFALGSTGVPPRSPHCPDSASNLCTAACACSAVRRLAPGRSGEAAAARWGACCRCRRKMPFILPIRCHPPAATPRHGCSRAPRAGWQHPLERTGARAAALRCSHCCWTCPAGWGRVGPTRGGAARGKLGGHVFHRQDRLALDVLVEA